MINPYSWLFLPQVGLLLKMKTMKLSILLATLVVLVQGIEEVKDRATEEFRQMLLKTIRTAELEREYGKLSKLVEIFEVKEHPLQEEKDSLLRSVESWASISRAGADFLEKFVQKDDLELSYKLKFEGHLVRCLKLNQQFEMLTERVNAIRVGDNYSIL